MWGRLKNGTGKYRMMRCLLQRGAPQKRSQAASSCLVHLILLKGDAIYSVCTSGEHVGVQVEHHNSFPH